MISKAGTHKATEQSHAEHHMLWMKETTLILPLDSEIVYYVNQIQGRIASSFGGGLLQLIRQYGLRHSETASFCSAMLLFI